MKKSLFILFIFFNILNFNAQDSLIVSKKEVISKTIFIQRDIKIDQDSINIIQFEANFKSKFQDEAFDYKTKKPERNIWDRFKEWLSDWLSKTFDFGDGQKAQKFAGYVINFIAATIIIFVVYLIVKSILNKEGQWIFGKNSDKKLIRYDDVERNLSATDFEKLIQETLLSGNKRYVIRYYYLWVLKKMSENEIIEWDLEKTNSDYLIEIKDKVNRENFAYLSYLYNYIWYGDFEMDDFNFEKSVSAFKKTIKSLQ